MLAAAIRSRFGTPPYTKSFTALPGTVQARLGYSLDSRARLANAMYGFGGNFLAGLLIGGALAILAPLLATDLAAGSAAAPRTENVSTQIKFDGQAVNRAAKSDRLKIAPNKQDAESAKPAKIPMGCDPAFSPLSKGAPNFSARCLAENLSGERGIVVAA
jgi:hypothetical protein